MKKIYANAAASNGIAIGKAWVIKKAVLVPDDNISIGNIENEIYRYKKAVAAACSRIRQLSKDSRIFKGHLMLIKDIALEMSVLEKLRSGRNAEQALSEAIYEYENTLKMSDDIYLKERSSDIKDIGNQILQAMKGEENDPFENINEATIVIADELAPSDIPLIYKNRNIKGIITQAGGLTSHVSILARDLGLPALIGADDILSQVKHGDIIILDAAAGLIIINPEHERYIEYADRAEEHVNYMKNPCKPSTSKAVTTDGKAIRLCINAGSIEEVKQANEYGAEGVGLFRSEILFMQYNHLPSEEEQYKAYKEIADTANGPVVIRALDIGGDKELPYFKLSKEVNPALGWRGIRILLDNVEIFKTQLKAVLRASVYGKLKLLLPMISSVDELIKTQALLKLCMQELRDEQLKFNESLETGIMVETPAAVLNIDNLVKHADFLSIGTNDLTQYLLAVDRGNMKVAELYNSLHPAIIRSIDMVIKAGRKYNKKVSLCGELAGDHWAARLLIGMGLKELSMAARNITQVRDTIANTEYKQAGQLAQKALSAANSEEIIKLLSL